MRWGIVLGFLLVPAILGLMAAFVGASAYLKATQGDVLLGSGAAIGLLIVALAAIGIYASS